MPEDNGSIELYLTKLNPDNSAFDPHKATSEAVARLYAYDDGFTSFHAGKKLVSFDKYSIRIFRCGSWLKFVKDEDNEYTLVDARFCKAPNCPMCQWRRALKWRAKFLTLLPGIQEKYPSHRWLFLTLTIRNCELDSLKPTLRHLNASFNRLSELSDFPMEGYVKSVEVTRVWDCYHCDNYLGRHGTKWVAEWERKNHTPLSLQPTTEVHPHLHITGMVKASYFTGRSYVTQERWSEMWKQSLRVDYQPILHIKAVKPKKGEKLPEPEQFEANSNVDETGMVKAICETLKYTVKEQDLIGTRCKDEAANANWLKLITQQLYKTRKVEYRGTLKEIGKELDAAMNSDNLVQIDEDNEEEEKTGELKEMVFRWNKSIEKYVLSETDVEFRGVYCQ